MLSGMACGFEAVDTDTYFPAVVQGHRGNNNAVCTGQDAAKLTQNNQAKITGTAGAALNFCDSNQGSGMPLDGCDNANGSRRLCSISDRSIRGMSTSGDNSFLSSSGGDGSLGYCNAGQQLTMGSTSQYQFGAISLYSTCTLTFSSARNEYRIESLAIGGGAKVILPAGDYWIGSLTINQGGVIETQGAVRIFVNEQAALNDGRLNPDNLGSVLLFGYADINLNGNSLINGLVYSDKTLNMNGSSIINGRTTSRSLFMTGSTAINDKAPPVPLACFSDDFSASTLSNNWVVARSSGNFTPAIVNGRLGMTQASTRQSTSATYQRLFPAANNLVTIEFDQYAHSGNGADGMAVVLSDARVTPQPGAFGGPLGYGFKPGVNGFAGGWLGVGIDEYGNFSGEGGATNKGRRQQSVVVRGSGSGTSGYNYLKGTCNNGAENTGGNCLSPTVDSGSDSNRPHRYRLTIDSRIGGQSMVKVERNTGGGYSTLIDSFNAATQSGQAAIPENLLLSLTGSTGDATNAHQIDNVRICALNSSPVGTQIDHFEFDHSGQALTCNPETLTIRACANASCSQLFTEPVSATLTPLKSGSNGWVAGNQVSYSGNTATVNFSGGTTTLQLRNNLASAMTVGVSGSTPSTKPLSTTLCQAGSGALSAAACTLSFADSGFVFDVLDTLANKPQQVVMTAVRKDNTSQLCVPSFQKQTKRITFWSDYNVPATNLFGSQIRIDKTAIATTAGTPTAMDLYFNELGETTLKDVSYPDAGQMRLNARHDGSGDTAGLVMTGSDTFVSRPVGLCIKAPQGECMRGANATNADYAANCPVFKKTGETFSLNIQAVAWQSDDDKDLCSGNQATPNFALANIALGSTLVAPKPGVEAVVGTSRYDHSNQKGSSNLNTVSQSVNEVGLFSMTATPPVAGYFNYTIPPAASVPVGRFVPWDFNMTSGTVTPACSGFSYMSQPFGVDAIVVARNKQGDVTKNYDGAFARGTLSLVAANNQDGVDRSNRLVPLAASWSEGTGKVTGQSRFMRLRELAPSLTAPEEPLPLLRLGLRVVDGETPETSVLADRNMNPAVTGICQNGVNCTARQLSIPKGAGDTMSAYYGRLLASTRQGAASAPLALPLQVQYFEGGLWRTNQQDVCSQISLAGGGIVFTDADQRYDAATGDLILKDGTRIRLGLGNVAPGGTQTGFDGGETRFHFAPPNQAVRIPYQIVLEKQPLQPLAPTWLADPATSDHLMGMAIFGRDRGNDRIIYRREVMP
ncbi:DUF6701 domain-containing protein [Aeromonas sp. OTU364]|uniref:DUF6701 domain-containing protein n=1 Tax=Aeromonas sp. OTU364 TaxID=3043864 RepID=UPI00313BA6DB